MSFNVKTIAVFERQATRLIKKYPSLKKEISELIQSLKSDPEQGIALGKRCYKIRIAVASKSKGKSGGARVVTYVQVIEKNVVLLAIIDKSEQYSISDNELRSLLNFIN